MKEITKTSKDNYRYYPAGKKNSQGKIRQSSFLMLVPDLISNNDSEFVDGYSAFKSLADQIHMLIENGVESFHVDYFETRTKRYSQQERVIKQCRPVINGKPASRTLTEPGFNPPKEGGIKSLKDLDALLKNFTSATPEAETSINFK
jgi:hypothetical protein